MSDSPLSVDSLEHEQCPSKIPLAVLRDLLVQTRRLRPAFPFPGIAQNRAYLLFRRRGNPNQQGSRTNRRNDIRSAVCQQNQPQVGTVLLHSPSQSRLRIASKVIGLVDDDDLEPLLRREIDLLGLRDLLQKFLDHDAVIVADVGRCDLKVVDGRDDVELQFPVTRRLEDSSVDLDLLDSGAVQFLQCCDYAGFLARAGRSVDEEVREVSALSLTPMYCEKRSFW